MYYRSEIEREEVWYDRDSDGKERRNTRKVSMYSNTKQVPFQLEDDSGSVPIDLDGAEIEAFLVLSGDGFPANRGCSGATGTLANTLSSIASAVAQTDIRHYELVLGVNIPAYVLGQIHAGGTVGKPAKGSTNKTFVVSYKSEEERAKNIGSSMTFA